MHETDPPVPLHVQRILSQNLTILKIALVKYSVQGGLIPVSEWKKKADETFPNDNANKIICLIESLKTESSKKANILVKPEKSYKETVLQLGYEMVKPHL